MAKMPKTFKDAPAEAFPTPPDTIIGLSIPETDRDLRTYIGSGIYVKPLGHSASEDRRNA